MSRPVCLISDASAYVGPALARRLAASHDFVLGDPLPELIRGLEEQGARSIGVAGVRLLQSEDAASALVDTALKQFGRIDSAVASTGLILIGRFLKSTIEDLRAAYSACVETTYVFLRAVVPAMVERRSGQILVFTSAAAARPTPGAPLYSSARAAATMLVRNVAAEVAEHNVQINAIGSNFIDFDGFLTANHAEDAAGRARVEGHVPMGRLGSLEELAHFAAAFVDGQSGFTTGQFVAYAGGWA